MGENQIRRRARRQPRGLLRADEILVAAGALFADVGYDRTTTNLIAARAGVSPGSLYQYFPNKEAIAHAYAAAATARLHGVYDVILSPAVIRLPWEDVLDAFIDALVAFNRGDPGYLALAVASTISAPLALALVDLQRGIFDRLDALIAALWPHGSPEQRRLRMIVSHRLFVALLPLALGGSEEDRGAIVGEMKAVLSRYWQPIIETRRGSDTPESDARASENDPGGVAAGTHVGSPRA